MELNLLRKNFTELSTIGQLYLDAAPECLILEDVDRGLLSSMTLDEIKKIKIKDQTAIPYGRYRITLRNSPHFARLMPHLENVPGYSESMIHWGNRPKNTEGCLLTGMFSGVDFVGESIVAFNQLYPKITAASDRGEEIWITIKKWELT